MPLGAVVKTQRAWKTIVRKTSFAGQWQKKKVGYPLRTLVQVWNASAPSEGWNTTCILNTVLQGSHTVLKLSNLNKFSQGLMSLKFSLYKTMKRNYPLNVKWQLHLWVTYELCDICFTTADSDKVLKQSHFLYRHLNWPERIRPRIETFPVKGHFLSI